MAPPLGSRRVRGSSAEEEFAALVAYPRASLAEGTTFVNPMRL